MQKLIIIISFVLLTTLATSQGGWFSKDHEKEQRQQAEQRLQHAQEQIQTQQQTIMQLHTHTSAFAAGAVVLLIVGIALGAKVKRDGNRS